MAHLQFVCKVYPGQASIEGQHQQFMECSTSAQEGQDVHVALKNAQQQVFGNLSPYLRRYMLQQLSGKTWGLGLYML